MTLKKENGIASDHNDLGLTTIGEMSPESVRWPESISLAALVGGVLGAAFFSPEARAEKESTAKPPIPIVLREGELAGLAVGAESHDVQKTIGFVNSQLKSLQSKIIEVLASEKAEKALEFIQLGNKQLRNCRRQLELVVDEKQRQSTVPTLFAVTNSAISASIPVGNLRYPSHASEAAKLFHLANILENRMAPLNEQFNQMGSKTVEIPGGAKNLGTFSDPLQFQKDFGQLKVTIERKILPFLDQVYPRESQTSAKN